MKKTWRKHFLAALKRNKVIILRNKALVLFEVLSPLLLITLLSISISNSALDKLRSNEYSRYFLTPEDGSNFICFVSPNTTIVQDIMNPIISKRNTSVKYFINETSASTEYLKTDHQTIIGIHFYNKSSYALRFPHRVLPSRENIFADLSKKCVINHILEHCSSTIYKYTGFAWLQQQINVEIMKNLKIKRNISLEKTVMFEILDSHPEINSFYYILCSFCFIILFVGMLNTLVVSLVSEKEENVMKFMKIMGVTRTAYYASWALIYSLLVFAISFISCLLLLNVFVLKHTNFLLLFLFLFAYGLTFITMGLLIVEIFKNSNVAGHVISSLVIIYSLVYIFVSRFEFEEGNQISDLFYIFPFFILIFSSLFSPIAFSLGMNQILSLESNRKGLTMKTLSSGEYSVLMSFMMLTVDFIFYIAINVFIKKWKELKLQAGSNVRRVIERPLNEHEMVAGLCHEHGSENDATTTAYRVPMISISKLYKVYNKGKSNEVTALNNLNLSIFENEVTAVIGPNGAGKTTLFDILAGLSSSTSGTAEVYGMDVSNVSDLKRIRSMIGFCSQQDMLYQDLTCEEQLHFFLKIKNFSSSTLHEINELIPPEVQGTHISKLSTGQKQKLKFAIALIGNPKILILDELTSGMDILARSTVWKVLKKLRFGRVILISTHLMNEADSLADKKIVLSNGSLQCCGSSLFLKSHFGIGYHLTLILEDSDQCESAEMLIKSVIPDSTIESVKENNISFNLPLSARNKFSTLFEVIEKHVEQRNESLIIARFNVTMSTLDEVLDKIQSGVSSNDDSLNINHEDSFEEIVMQATPKASVQLLAMVKRKITDDRRNLSLLAAKLTFPILFIICFIISSKIITFKLPLYVDESPFLLDYSIYGPSKGTIGLYSNVDHRMNFNVDGKIISDVAFNHSDRLNLLINVTDENVIGSYQESYLHAIPILINSISNLMLKIDFIANISKPEILVYNWVWPATTRDNYVINVQQINQMLYFISFSILTVASMFPTAVVIDRNRYIVRQLKLTNVSSMVYWLSNLIPDCLQMIVLLIVSLMTFFAGHKLIISASFYFLVLVLTLQYVPALLLFSYFITLVCKKTSFVQFYTPIIFYLLGFSIHFFLDIFLYVLPHSVRHITCTIVPPYGMILTFDSFHLLFEVFHYDDSVYDLHHYFGIHYFRCIISPWISSVFYFVLLIVSDKMKDVGILYHLKSKFARFYKSPYEPEDSSYFLNNQADSTSSIRFDKTTVISMKQLTKVYKPFSFFCCRRKKKIAISNVNLDVVKNETLGLLGPNGAGKSTLIGMIVNDITPTRGHVEICGKKQTLCGKNIFSKLSYCPQENSCWDNITVKEHLQLFLQLRGIVDEKKDLANVFLEKLGLQNELHKRFKDLSFGNKRKLCFAMSQMCRSEAVILDEPTSGLDPISKKSLWKCHKMFSKKNSRGMILSTHSLEEAEVLCDKLAIIIKGRIQCTGLIHQLKNLSDSGYILEVRLKSTAGAENMLKLKEFVADILIPGSEIINECYDWISFKTVQNLMPKLSKTFQLLESEKDRLEIDDYSLSQATLERVFLELFKHQLEDDSGGDLNLLDVLHPSLRTV